MPEYHYTARNQVGEKIEGVVEAAGEREVAAALAGKGLFPLKIHPIAGQQINGKIRPVKGQQLVAFYSQLADLLKGGVPLLKSLRILHDQTSNQNFKYILDQVYRRVEEGATLAEAMQRYQVAFGEMGVQMIRAGSEGGFLEESLIHVAQYTEVQDDLRSRVVGAMMYPILLSTFLFIVISIILGYFIPKFEDFFNGLREQGELPLITTIVISLGNWTKLLLPILVPLLIFAVIAARTWSKTDKGRRFFDVLKMKLPVLGNLYRGFAVARFCRILGTLLRNGVPIVKSLDISADATGNRILGDAIAKASENITAGERLAGPLAASQWFPRSVVEMISVAEEANTLDTVLVGISDSLEKRNWRALDLAVRLMEPLMLIVLGSVVLVLVVSIMLPIFRLSTTI
ncbi:MAG: type II secretion system F family protein [Planctomycetaceae bacterium]|jgi:general secretion pathway protein F/type IV pilus assembly protein PilC|nr:type II secretion system F family protein [Planctomycetaceae bacterium]